MKTLTLILASVLLMQAEGYFIKVQNTPTNSRIVPVGWVHVQKLLLPLFENVCEESTEPIIVRLNEEFKLNPTVGNYLKPEVINNLLNLKATKGLLAKGDIFTEYDSDHNNELKIVYEVLYYARDFDTFFKAACWARQNLNCGLFVDAIYLAVITRRDTEKVSVPPPYELLPNYFIRKDFITKASSLIREEDIATDTVRNEGNAYILDVNYTTNFYDDGDDKLAYFHEDVGLNSYYFLTKLKQNQWLKDIGYLQNNNGEYIYHTMKQLMTRYNLERYSNGLPELEGIDWDNIYDLPYDPMLIYSNGNSFSERISIKNNKEIITLLKNIESNLPAAVIHMRDKGYNKSEILNYIMEILVTNEKSYESLALTILSDNDSGSSSVLGHYLTRVRDPIFWRLNKKIVDMIDHTLIVLPSYTRNQLYFPGVEITNIEIKNILTLFDNFEFDVTDAFKTDEEPKFEIKIAQSRLNHKPFTVKMNIASLVAQKALVKIYIGPKFRPGELAKKKNLFMFLDCFEANLKIGTNILSRKSNEVTNLSEDLLSTGVIHKNILDTEFGIDALALKSVWSQIQFPSRLILPKGTSSGLPFQLFVFVAPYVLPSVGDSRTNLEVNLEALVSPEYPLDLDMETQQLFSLPNAFVKDIIITHKTESTSTYNKPINTFNKGFNDRVWPTDETDYRSPNGLLALAAQPAFTKKRFDYQSKKNQFGKRPNFSYTRADNYKDVKTVEQSDKTDDLTTVKVEDQPKNTEFINNMYISSQMDHKVEEYINENGNRLILDKNKVNNDLQKEVIEEVINDINVMPHKETDNKNIVNNVILDKEDDVNIMNNDLQKEVIEEVINDINVMPHKETDNKNIVDNVILDKEDDVNIMNNDLQKEVIKEFYKDMKVIPHKETDNKKIVDNVILNKEDEIYNILPKKVNEEFNTKFDMVQKVVEDTNVLDKDNENSIFNNEINEPLNKKLDNITIKESNKVPPHGLLTMPRKRFSNIFKVVFAQKPEYDETVYV